MFNSLQIRFNFAVCFAIGVVLLLVINCTGENDSAANKMVVPQIVTDVFSSKYPDAVLSEYSEEEEDGGVVYEIEFVDQGRKLAAKYASDGELLELEEVITVDELPGSVLQSLSEQYDRYSVLKIERIYLAGKTSYEIEFVDLSANKHLENVYLQDGMLVESGLGERDE